MVVEEDTEVDVEVEDMRTAVVVEDTEAEEGMVVDVMITVVDEEAEEDTGVEEDTVVDVTTAVVVEEATPVVQEDTVVDVEVEEDMRTAVEVEEVEDTPAVAEEDMVVDAEVEEDMITNTLTVGVAEEVDMITVVVGVDILAGEEDTAVAAAEVDIRFSFLFLANMGFKPFLRLFDSFPRLCF